MNLLEHMATLPPRKAAVLRDIMITQPQAAAMLESLTEERDAALAARDGVALAENRREEFETIERLLRDAEQEALKASL